MVYNNAGHPPPLIIRANGLVEPLAITGPSGSSIGAAS
jgi:serine phosphatase RsbU (regulator of sigma subunit)